MHPYSRKLFESLPSSAARKQGLAVIRGTVPSMSAAFTGCRFAERCDVKRADCDSRVPDWVDLDARHGVRCLLYSSTRHGAPERDALRFDSAGNERNGKGSPDAALPSPDSSDARSRPLLTVNDLEVHFPIQRGLFKRTVGSVKAVDGVSLRIGKGECLALVGESGCGKTTAGKAILRLIRPTAGQIFFGETDLGLLSETDMRVRRKDFQIIFQDPYASLNPRMRVADIIEEGMRALDMRDAGWRRQRIDELLVQVGLLPETKTRYPHEFSGGQRQRIAIARALAVEPKLLICDEPTSALDVSVQAQILNLLKELQARLGLSYLFITHDFSVVDFIAHHVAVMYLGRIVEYGTFESVLNNPFHPYTRALLSAVPSVDLEGQRRAIRLEGDLPSPADPPDGCHFHPRCPQVSAQCRAAYPQESRISDEHKVNCHLYAQVQ